MSTFKDFEDEYISLTNSVNSDISTLSGSLPSNLNSGTSAGAGSVKSESSTSNVNRPELMQRLRTNIDKLREIVAYMELEINEVPVESRNQSRQRVAGYKKAVTSLENDMVGLRKSAMQADRDDLIRSAKHRATANGANNEDPDHVEMKVKLARDTDKMKQGSKTLRDAERLTNQMNDLADDTMIQLDKQGEKIQKIHEKTRETDQELDFVGRILKQMHRTMIKNKLMLAAIIAVLVILIIGILYYQFGSSHSSSAATPPAAYTPVVPVEAPPSPGGGRNELPHITLRPLPNDNGDGTR